MDKRYLQFMAMLIGLSAFALGIWRLFSELDPGIVYVSTVICAGAAGRWYARVHH